MYLYLGNNKELCGTYCTHTVIEKNNNCKVLQCTMCNDNILHLYLKVYLLFTMIFNCTYVAVVVIPKGPVTYYKR